MKKVRYLSPYDKDHGYFTDPFMPNTFAVYGDCVFDTVLMGLREKIEKYTKLKLKLGKPGASMKTARLIFNSTKSN